MSRLVSTGHVRVSLPFVLALALAHPAFAQQQPTPAKAPQTKPAPAPAQKAQPRHLRRREGHDGRHDEGDDPWRKPQTARLAQRYLDLREQVLDGPVRPARRIDRDGNQDFDYGRPLCRGDLQRHHDGHAFEGTGIDAYDNVSKQFVSSWIDNFGTGLTVLKGRYDGATKTWTYTGEEADIMAPGKTYKIRQTVRIESADRFVMEWFDTHSGKEAKSMEIVYTRRK